MAGEKLMTVEEFGQRIGVPRSTAYRIVRTAPVKTVDIGTGGRVRLRISEAALSRYLAERERKRIA